MLLRCTNRKLLGAEEYDLVILGGGTGSTIAAWTFAGQGQRVAVIERKHIGGSYPNIACMPSKNGLNDLYRDNFNKTGAEFIIASGRFVGPRTVETTLNDGTTRQLRGANVIVSTSTRSALEPIPGLAEAQPLTHIEALELDHVPEHFIAIGAGYVGVELSQAMRRFGSRLSVFDRNDRLMHREDDDVSKALGSLFEDKGITAVLNARIKRVSGKSGDSVTVVVEQGWKEKTLEGSHLLVAAGRRPNTPLFSSTPSVSEIKRSVSR